MYIAMCIVYADIICVSCTQNCVSIGQRSEWAGGRVPCLFLARVQCERRQEDEEEEEEEEEEGGGGGRHDGNLGAATQLQCGDLHQFYQGHCVWRAISRLCVYTHTHAHTHSHTDTHTRACV